MALRRQYYDGQLIQVDLMFFCHTNNLEGKSTKLICIKSGSVRSLMSMCLQHTHIAINKYVMCNKYETLHLLIN